MPQPTLILVHEPERACFDRLIADGYPAERAMERDQGKEPRPERKTLGGEREEWLEDGANPSWGLVGTCQLELQGARPRRHPGWGEGR